MSSTKLIVAIVALTGALSASVAQARENDDVQWSVTIGAPAAVPVHGQPYPAYRQPAPTYPRYQYQQPTRWDRDGDGIPNRYDRVYNPRWDRDGDGIPNRYDRHDNLRHDRDGDGIPNWRDNYNGNGRGWDR
jgi:hypothetical protein